MSSPRIGFLGVGWIGRHRMASMCSSGTVVAAALCDPDPGCLVEAHALVPKAVVVDSLDAMLALELDGIVIATPSALHAEQAIAALETGAAVFCQKPVGRNAAEVRAVVEAARQADRLLSADFSYRYTRAATAVKSLIDSGALGRIFAVDLVFHNAYGPDKAWFYDPVQSGGGCIMDLGVHLVDLLLWSLEFPPASVTSAQFYANGSPLEPPLNGIEDYATGQIALAGDVTARLACSWRLHAGREAVIEASFYGTEGGAAIRNVGGSFYDFEAVGWHGTSSEQLVAPPDEWGGRAASAWAESLTCNPRWNPDATRYVEVAELIDAIYRQQ